VANIDPLGLWRYLLDNNPEIGSSVVLVQVTQRVNVQLTVHLDTKAAGLAACEAASAYIYGQPGSDPVNLFVRNHDHGFLVAFRLTAEGSCTSFLP
jgi:hypothetical protein